MISMVDVQEVSRDGVPVESGEWVQVERGASGRFVVSGSALSDTASVFFNPPSFDSLQQAVAAARTWAFHHDIEVIYVCS